MLYEFHPLAARELDEAVDHYESLAAGKDLELAQQIKGSINQVCEFIGLRESNSRSTFSRRSINLKCAVMLIDKRNSKCWLDVSMA